MHGLTATGQRLLAEFDQRVHEHEAKRLQQQMLWRYLPTRVNGRRYNASLPNGDFACQVWTLLQGRPDIMRPQPWDLVAMVG